ncbi:Hypothetical predicted protein, partial [Mytilus galloprovincialis]
EKGIWIFPLFDEKNPPRNYATTCKKWQKQQDIISPHPSCPCTYTQALLDKRLHMDTTTSCAELISPTPQGYGVLCCYDAASTGALLTGLRGTSKFYRYHPRLSPTEHQTNDLDAETACCQLDKSCDSYYQYRPSPTCVNYTALTCAHVYGTPHITTFDGLEYTFSNKGEFVLAYSPTGIQVQGRLEHPWLNGAPTEQNTNTTVYTAFAIHEAGSSNITIMFNEKRTGIEIIVDGTRITNQLSQGTIYDISGGAIRQDGECYVVTYNSGFAAEFCHVDKTIQMTLCSEPYLLDGVTGLLGTANNNQTDDIQTPSGTLPTNQSDPSLYQILSEWAVTPDTTRFWYNNGYSNENYTQDNYIPIFQEDISDATIAQTNDTCGDNKLCQYDTIILGPTVGSNTKQEYEKVKNKDKIKDNYVPPPEGTQVVNVTINDQTTFEIQKPIPGMSINCQLPLNATCSEETNTSVKVTWTPTNFDPTILRFVGEDTLGGISQALGIVINICDCNNHGTCDFDKLLYDQNPNSYFRKVKCTCEEGWTGTHCDLDFNGCEGAPCESRGTTCEDLSPANHRANKYPYKCKVCGNGYQKGGINQTKCYDVNECKKDKGICGIHNCKNQKGKHTCLCKRGFLTNVNGECAPEPTPLDKDVELEVSLDGKFSGSDNKSISES